MKAPTKFVRETPAYYVLADMPSKSDPSKSYEIRTSKRDGKSYCNCLGWVHKARKGDGLCKHLLEFKAKTFEPVVVYKWDEFVSVKRGVALITDAEVSKNVVVRRK